MAWLWRVRMDQCTYTHIHEHVHSFGVVFCLGMLPKLQHGTTRVSGHPGSRARYCKCIRIEAFGTYPTAAKIIPYLVYIISYEFEAVPPPEKWEQVGAVLKRGQKRLATKTKVESQERFSIHPLNALLSRVFNASAPLQNPE